MMSGNEAIARGFYEAGGHFASAYPGTPSTEILENISLYKEIIAQWAPNEKVALEVTAGAGIGGMRALAAMKHVGLNVAADPFFSLSYQGVNAGLVIISADDPSMHSSQNEQDNRWFARAAKVAMLEPSDSQEAKDFTKMALEISEQFDMPVLLRTTTRINHSKTIVELCDRTEVEKKTYKKDMPKNVLLPGNARKKHILIEEQLKKLSEYGNNCKLNKIEWNDKKIGIITSGIAYQYIKDVFPTASILKLGLTNPLPYKLIKDFAAQVNSLYVIEELDPFLEEQIAAMGIKIDSKNKLPVIGELNPNIIAEAFGIDKNNKNRDIENNVAIPARPPVLCPGCSHRGIYYVLKKLRLIVTGDIGCYTLGAIPPLETTDTCLCMGASVGYAQGMLKAGGDKLKGKVIGVIGDSTFIHSGITGIIDLVYNQSIAKICILDNHTTAMTGHQENPSTGLTLHHEPTYKVDLEAMCRATGINRIIKVDPYNINENLKIFKEEMAIEEPSIIIADAPCIIRDRIRFNNPYSVLAERCNKCGICHRIGCSAIEKDENDITKINSLLCIGCDLCRQVCKQEAIQKP